MSSALGYERSLTVFRVMLKRRNAYVGSASALEEPSASQQMILCALEVTGDPLKRGLLPTEEQFAPTRRAPHPKKPRSGDGCESRVATRTVAQWILSPADLDLPLTYEDASEFQDRASRAYDALADGARSVASALFKEYQTDTLINSVRAQGWIPSGTLRLPPDLSRELQHLLPTLLSASDQLWVELTEPVGYLPLIPWEALLQPLLGAPVLRLSPHPIRALGSNRELTAVFACSFASPQWLPKTSDLQTLLTSVTRSLPAQSTIHIFADAITRPSVHEILPILTEASRSSRLILHQPPDSGSNNPTSESTADGVAVQDHPWLTWMTSAIGRDAVDIFHWISPAMLLPDGPRLVVARNPEVAEVSEGSEPSKSFLFWRKEARGRKVRFLDASALASAATAFGAWAMVFTAAGRGRTGHETVTGLRLLVDQLSRLRPGVVCLHQLDLDQSATAISAGYKFLVGTAIGYSYSSPALSIYCHPDRVASESSEAIGSPDNTLLSAYTAARGAAQAKLDEPGPSPAWVATTQRLMEQVASQFVKSGPQVSEKTSLDEASERGVTAAIQLVEKLLSEQSSR